MKKRIFFRRSTKKSFSWEIKLNRVNAFLQIHRMSMQSGEAVLVLMYVNESRAPQG